MADAHLTSRLWESCVPGGASGYPRPGGGVASPGDSLTADGVGRTAASGQSGVAWEPPPEETPGQLSSRTLAGTLWSLGSKLHTWASLSCWGGSLKGAPRIPSCDCFAEPKD